MIKLKLIIRRIHKSIAIYIEMTKGKDIIYRNHNIYISQSINQSSSNKFQEKEKEKVNVSYNHELKKKK